MNDSFIWACFKAGSIEAFSGMYCTHYVNLFHYGCRFTPDADLVKDAIHDLFLDLWIRRSRLGETASIKHYLLKCLKRRVVKAVLRSNLTVVDYNSSRTESPEEEFNQDEKITSDEI